MTMVLCHWHLIAAISSLDSWHCFFLAVHMLSSFVFFWILAYPHCQATCPSPAACLLRRATKVCRARSKIGCEKRKRIPTFSLGHFSRISQDSPSYNYWKQPNWWWLCPPPPAPTPHTHKTWTMVQKPIAKYVSFRLNWQATCPDVKTFSVRGAMFTHSWISLERVLDVISLYGQTWSTSIGESMTSSIGEGPW